MKVIEINARGIDRLPVSYRVICDEVVLQIPEDGAGLVVFHFTGTTYVEFSEQGSTFVRRGKLEVLGFQSLISFEVDAEEAAANEENPLNLVPVTTSGA